MKKLSIATMMLCAFGLPMGAMADAHESDETYIYSTYMLCDLSREEAVDEEFESVVKPIFEQSVKDGVITGWGWLVHHTGGKWRRARYHAAGDMESLIAALENIGGQVQEQVGDYGVTSEICSGHEDYIWRSVTGSGGGPLESERGKVGMSAYHVCKMSREGRADELVEKIFAPVYNDHVGEGKLRSWGWSEHIVGGKYRRLGTMTADDWPTLLKMRAAIFDAIADMDSELADEFTEICYAHIDYMWEIPHEG